MLRLDPEQTIRIPTGMTRSLSFRRLRQPTRLPRLTPSGTLRGLVERAMGLLRSA